MSDIEVLGSTHRRAVDWSKVRWISECLDGTSTICFDNKMENGVQWLNVPVPFDDVVARWRRWKRSGVDYSPDADAKHRWWRCW